MARAHRLRLTTGWRPGRAPRNLRATTDPGDGYAETEIHPDPVFSPAQLRITVIGERRPPSSGT
jgi:hypothetical protein